MYKFVSVSKAPECGTIHTSLFFVTEVVHRSPHPPPSSPTTQKQQHRVTKIQHKGCARVCYSTITARVCYLKSVLGCATSQWVHGNNKCMCIKVECARSACAWKQGVHVHEARVQTNMQLQETDRKYGGRETEKKRQSYSQYLRAVWYFWKQFLLAVTQRCTSQTEHWIWLSCLIPTKSSSFSNLAANHTVTLWTSHNRHMKLGVISLISASTIELLGLPAERT